jgi:hypothetical protein
VDHLVNNFVSVSFYAAAAWERQMTEISQSLIPVDSLAVNAIADDVSDAYVSKTLYAVSEFSNIVRAGAKVIMPSTHAAVATKATKLS